MPTFLVIRFSSIGDILMTTPAVRALKRQVPGARVLFATKPAFVPLVTENPYIDKVLPLTSNLFSLAMTAYGEGVTHIVDLHSNVRSRVLSALFPFAKTYRVDKGTADREALIKDKSHRVQPLHMVDRHLACLGPLGVKWDGSGLDYRVPEADRVDFRLWSIIGQIPYAAVCIGANHFTKRMPVEKLEELLRTIPYPVILLGGAEVAEMGRVAAGALALEGRWDIFSACGDLTLGQSGSVLEQAEVVYAHDTGLMHMAASLGKPVHSIWGNTVPAFGMYPFGTRFTVQEVAGLVCRPCHRHGLEQCPLPDHSFPCMWKQDFSQELKWWDVREEGTREAMASLTFTHQP